MPNLVKKILVIALIAVAQTVAEEVLAKPFRRKRKIRTKCAGSTQLKGP